MQINSFTVRIWFLNSTPTRNLYTFMHMQNL
ncbi:hypothetical protein NC651_013193 [Populus alba x Populus x berolinensis]|nr:hypothetical protein NC651_013193 [Populus alba x Populus x berolinensis]